MAKDQKTLGETKFSMCRRFDNDIVVIIIGSKDCFIFEVRIKIEKKYKKMCDIKRVKKCKNVKKRVLFTVVLLLAKHFALRLSLNW